MSKGKGMEAAYEILCEISILLSKHIVNVYVFWLAIIYNDSICYQSRSFLINKAKIKKVKINDNNCSLSVIISEGIDCRRIY